MTTDMRRLIALVTEGAVAPTTEPTAPKAAKPLVEGKESYAFLRSLAETAKKGDKR